MVKGYEVLPWFPMDPREISRMKFRKLTAEEFGAFMRLRCELWLEEQLPDDDKLLAEVTGTGKRWPRIKTKVVACLELTEGNYKDAQLEVTRNEQIEKRNRRVKAAQTRWNSERNGTHKEDSACNADAMHMQGVDAMSCIRGEKSREEKSITSTNRAEVRALSPALSTRPPENARECVTGFASEYERTHERAYSPESNDVDVMQGLLDKGASLADVQTRIGWFFPWWPSYHRSRDGHQLPNVQEFVWAFNKIPPSGASGKAVSQYEDVN